MTIDTASLTQQLIGARNPDGGWGYYRGKSSRLEPTSWAFLALSQDPSALGDRRALAEWPATDRGLLLERVGGTPNYGFHGLALLVMSALGIEHAGGTASLVAGIQRVKGVALENSPANGTQDNSLQAWSWIADTFSWIEPTGWCLLSLKKRRAAGASDVDAARVTEAEKLLINRVCATGGWNYGNADVLGEELRAYVPTTAIGLLAMQDRTDNPAIARSVDFLEQHALSESSGSALALAMLALRAFNRNDAAVRTQLLGQLPTTIDMGNVAAMAAALYALGTTGTYAAFSL